MRVVHLTAVFCFLFELGECDKSSGIGKILLYFLKRTKLNLNLVEQTLKYLDQNTEKVSQVI